MRAFDHFRGICLCLLLAYGPVSSGQAQQSRTVDAGVRQGGDTSPARLSRLPEISFEHVRLPGGTTSNIINGMAQDRQGFLWLATRASLTRYDGYETTTYRHDPARTASLAHSKWVETVYVDRDGTLWVGTFGGGLDRFHPETETFSHFRHDPSNPASLSGDTVIVMLEDRAGALWVGTHQGLNRMDSASGTFTRFRHDPEDPASLSNDQVRIIYEDDEGTLWVGTGSPWGGESPDGAGGLNRFDPQTETFTRYLYDQADESRLIGSHVTALFEDSRGNFWVGTSGDGLHSMDRQRGTFTRHTYDAEDRNQLSMPHLDEFTGPAYVSVVHEDRHGTLWIGAINGGLSRYNPATGQLVLHRDAPGDPGHLGTTYVSGVFESREGVLWVVTWDGLYKIVPPRDMLRHHALDAAGTRSAGLAREFLEDSEGNLWVGAETGGLRQFSSEQEVRTDDWSEPGARFLHDSNDPQSLSSNFVLSIYEDREGVLWVGTAAGLDRLDRRRGRFIRYQHDPDDPESLGAGPVYSIREDLEGMLWIGSYGGGLSRLDRSTGRIKQYLHDPANPNSLSDNDVVVVHADQEGILWVGMLRGGLNRLDPRSGQFTRYPYQGTRAA